MTGKGSNPRPMRVSRDEFRKRWDETFARRTLPQLVGHRTLRYDKRGRLREIDFSEQAPMPHDDSEASIYLTPSERAAAQEEINRRTSRALRLIGKATK